MAKTFAAQPLAGAVDRRRQGHGAAAGDGAEPDRDRRGVGERHHHVVGIDRPGIGHDLREDRLHALALRAGAATRRRLAGRIDPHRRALERADAGALDVAADPEAEVAALLARRALARAKRRDAADRVERLAQRRPDNRRRHRRSARRRDREAPRDRASRRRDHVAQAHVGGLEAERAGDEIDRPLHREGGFRAAGAPIGRVRDLVGGGDPGFDRDGVDLVGAGEMHGGVVDDAGSDRIPCPAIDDEIGRAAPGCGRRRRSRPRRRGSGRANGTSTSDARDGPRSIAPDGRAGAPGTGSADLPGRRGP